MDNYKDFEHELSRLIYEKSEKGIPKDMCLNLARVINNRRKENVSDMLNLSIEECADIAIKNYYA